MKKLSITEQKTILGGMLYKLYKVTLKGGVVIGEPMSREEADKYAEEYNSSRILSKIVVLPVL